MNRTQSARTGLMCFGVIATTFFACGSSLGTEHEERVERIAPTAEADEEDPLRLGSIADISEQAIPSVVNVSTTRKVAAERQAFGTPFHSDPFFRRFFDQLPQQQQRPPREHTERGVGSGVIVDAKGVILTNNHVIDGADEVTVTLHDGREYEAEVVGRDPPSDLAVLKLKDAPSGLRALPLGDSDAVRLGEVVVAIGNPFGVGQTVTMGIVSAKGRANMGIVDYEDFIQTDAAINPGNSGGALLSLRGEMIGVNTAILSRTGGSQGIGFAIPSNMAKNIMQSLLQHGKVVRGFLGVMIQDLTPDLAGAMEAGVEDGVVVSEVLDGSPAQKAGLRAGDIIVAVAGREVSTSAKLRNRIASMGVGRAVELEIIRDGKRRTVEVELGERESKALASESGSPDETSLGGIQAQELTEELARRLELPERVEEGVVVTDVQPSSPAERAGLRAGDVIVDIDRRAVKSTQDLRDAWERSGDTMLVRVYRGSGSIFIVLKK